MRTTKAGIIDMTLQLFKATEERKALEKLEKELKGVLKEFMGTEAYLEAGEYTVVIDTRHTSSIDKAALLEELGPEKIKQFIKETSYETVVVKPNKRFT